MRGGNLPLLSNARFSAFERLGECWDGVESGSGEGGISEEGAGGCHVVFAPLEVASWFFWEVLGYRNTESGFHGGNFSCIDGDAEGLENRRTTHLASSKRSEAKALDHYLSQLLETIATE